MTKSRKHGRRAKGTLLPAGRRDGYGICLIISSIKIVYNRGHMVRSAAKCHHRPRKVNWITYWTAGWVLGRSYCIKKLEVVLLSVVPRTCGKELIPSSAAAIHH